MFARSPKLPPVSRYLLAFQACNIFNFTIAVGAPMVLLARHLGADAAKIGFLISLASLLSALQILTINLVESYGYRRMIIAGWTARACSLLGIVPLPLLVGIVPTPILLWTLFGLLLLFSISRGLASGAWFPWMKDLIPEPVRGHYIGVEQRLMNFSQMLTLLGCSWFLGIAPAAWQYSALYVAAFAAGIVSVRFLAKAPDTRPALLPGHRRRSVFQIMMKAWEVWKYRPFRRFTRYMVLYTVALSALPGFLVLYMRDILNWTEAEVLLLQALPMAGVLVTAVTFGSWSDRFGSRPLLRLALWAQLSIVFFWLGSALEIYRVTHTVAGVILLFWGASTVLHVVPQVRFMLGCSPPDEVTVSMPLFNMIQSLVGGLSPITVGLLLQQFSGGRSHTGFIAYFALAAAITLAAHYLLSQVSEPKAVPTRRMMRTLLFSWPMRFFSDSTRN